MKEKNKTKHISREQEGTHQKGLLASILLTGQAYLFLFALTLSLGLGFNFPQICKRGDRVCGDRRGF